MVTGVSLMGMGVCVMGIGISLMVIGVSLMSIGVSLMVVGVSLMAIGVSLISMKPSRCLAKNPFRKLVSWVVCSVRSVLLVLEKSFSCLVSRVVFS